MKKYKVKIIKILADLKKQKMSIKDIIIMKIMNSLETAFVTYIIILNKNTQNDKNMFKIDDFFKKLKDEEHQIKQSNTSIINIVNQIQDCKDCEDHEDHSDHDNKRDKSTTSKSNTSYYTSCGDSHSNNIKCSYKY